MNIFNAIKQRRAVKSFDPDYTMTDEEINKILSMARLSPTAYNQQNYRFVIIKQPKLKEKIKQAAHGQKQVTDASLLIVLCADTKSWQRDSDKYWGDLDKDLIESKRQSMENYYKDRELTQRDEAMRSCALAAQTMMLTAKALKLDSCPMIGFDFDAVAKLINLPHDYLISMMMTIGKAKEFPKARFPQLPDEQIIFTDGFE